MKPTTSLVILAASAMNLHADYPVASHRYLADPSSLVTKDRVYIYCSNDDESPVHGSYNIPNVVCISSSDMKNWTDHGIVFDAARDTKWAKKTWAPCAIERDGKFYLYFGNGGGNIGVVVGDSPTGPFKDVVGKPLIEHGTPGVQPAKNMWLFDPGVFIDDDGQAYIYFGGNGDDNVRAAKLKKDMVTLDGEVIKMHAPNFFEAAWVWKKDGKYYFSYSSTPKAEMRIDYMTGDSPLEFKYAGIVAAQPPINNNNNHAVEFKFKDHWYHVYHNRIVATEAKIPTGFRRNIAAEEFTYERRRSHQAGQIHHGRHQATRPRRSFQTRRGGDLRRPKRHRNRALLRWRDEPVQHRKRRLDHHQGRGLRIRRRQALRRQGRQ